MKFLIVFIALSLSFFFSFFAGAPPFDSKDLCKIVIFGKRAVFGQVKKFAELGLTEAQYKLGLMYYYGLGVPQDNNEAIFWFKKADEQGHAKAYFRTLNSGQERHYDNYKTAAKPTYDPAPSFDLIAQMAAQGNAEAQHHRGLVYYYGLGLPQEDHKEALAWFKKAANQGYAEAQYKLGVIYHYGLGLPSDPLGLPADHKEAIVWFKKAANQGHYEAQHQLGMVYYYGLGDLQNYEKAMAWFENAAAQGNAELQYKLGHKYSSGERRHSIYQVRIKQQYGPLHYHNAVFWFKKAAAQGHARAQYELGLIYYAGLGGLQNYKEAATWFKKSADQGSAEAQFKLGLMYYYGIGVPRNYFQAVAFIGKAAHQGHYEAQKFQSGPLKGIISFTRQ